ncbi:unnamed protein product [Effrenium voratum]|uniref:Uncharacterized protein n=1 Tax=Effrenium voratum TaxID=2562239 RepID=A0AA36HUF1_9DINO|nr:unnamed protein product [Effrenium voratum]CAJ1447925.1 unnamed protein product [Effrenium voratum]
MPDQGPGGMFEIGACVVIHGLDGKEGAEAEITSFDDASATFECKMLAEDLDGEKVYCKAENMKLASEVDPDQRLADLVKGKAADRSDSSSEKRKSKKKSKKKKKKSSSSSSSRSSSSTNAPNRKKRGTMFNRSALEVAEKSAKRGKRDREGGAAAAAALLGLR